MPSITVSATSATNDSSIGTVPWNNPNNVTASDNSRATASVSSDDPTTQGLVVTPADLSSIPSDAVITGIELRIERSRNISTFGALVVDWGIQLGRGTSWFENKADVSTNWPASDTVRTYGHSSDLWGTTWTRTQMVNDLRARIAVQRAGTLTVAAQVDHVQFTVWYLDVHELAGSAETDVQGSGSMLGNFALQGQSELGIQASGELNLDHELIGPAGFAVSASGRIAGGITELGGGAEIGVLGSGEIRSVSALEGQSQVGLGTRRGLDNHFRL